MLSYIGRSSQFAPALKGSVQAVANGVKNVVPGAVDAAAPELVQKLPLALTPSSMAKRCPSGAVVAKAGLGGTEWTLSLDARAEFRAFLGFCFRGRGRSADPGRRHDGRFTDFTFTGFLRQ